MKYQGSFVLGVIGSILGMLLSLIWMEVGTEFWANMFSKAAGNGTSWEIPSTHFSIGFIIAGFQCMVTYVFFVVAFSKSFPKILAADPRKNGRWLLMVGIGTAIVNLFLLFPSILLIIAGTMVLKAKTVSERT